MLDAIFSLASSDFELKVKNIIANSYPTITDHVRMTTMTDPKGFSPGTRSILRERNGTRFVFIWGSTWGGKRVVSG